MLRALVAALILANAVFFAFSRGALDGLFGLRAAGDREPERLTNQVRPQTIRLLPTTTAAPSAPPEVATCWETPVFSAAEATAVEAILANTLPPGSWTDTRGERSVGTHTYRVTAADGALAARLTLIRLDPSGRGFSPCAKSAPR